MKKVIFSLIGVALIALGILMYPKNEQPETQPEVSVEIIEVEVPEATLDTSDWKEFRSEKFGISFKTPADWNNVQEENEVVLNDMGHDAFGWLSVSNNLKTEDELIKYFAKDNFSSIDVFFNKNGVKVYSTGTVYYALVRDNIYQITGLPDVIPTIITTLQLTEE